jgi:hypothetical protein
MLDRIVAAVALALLQYLERRIERGSTAVDAAPDRERLRRGSARIREWLRENGARDGGKPGTRRP